MKKALYILTIALTIVSCEFDFNLEGMDTEPLLHLEAIIHQEHDEVLRYRAQGLRSVAGDENRQRIDGFLIEAYVNGTLADSFRGDREVDMIGGGLNLRTLIPGDHICIKAISEGYPEISAETVMPDRWEDLDVSVKRLDENTVSIDVSFSDNPDQEDFYGLGFMVETFIDPQIVSRSSVALRGPSVEGTGYTSYGEMRVSYLDPKGMIINICSDHSFNGKEKRMSFIADCLESNEHENRTYTILAYKLSPEMYRYAVAQYDSSPWNNTLGFMGLSPVTFTYTNIQGGLGVLGCVNMRTCGPYPVP